MKELSAKKRALRRRVPPLTPAQAKLLGKQLHRTGSAEDSRV